MEALAALLHSAGCDDYLGTFEEMGYDDVDFLQSLNGADMLDVLESEIELPLMQCSRLVAALDERKRHATAATVQKPGAPGTPANGSRADVSVARGALIDAAYDGDAALVASLLQQGADIDATDHHKHTALIGAVVDKNMEITRLLLQHNAALECESVEGYTALIAAVMTDNAEAAKLLLEKGASVETRNANGTTALDVARLMNKTALANEIERVAEQRKRTSKATEAASASTGKQVPRESSDSHAKRDSARRAARASLSGAFRAGSGKEGGVGRIGGRAAVAAGGAGGGGGADRNGGRPDERRARSRGSRVSSKPRAAAEF